MSKKDTFYFSHDYYARMDRKLVKLAMKHGMAGIGVYWCIIEMLYEECGFLPIDYDQISFDLRTTPELIKSVINDFELFDTEDDTFFSYPVIDRLKERAGKSEKARQSIQIRWDKVRKSKT